MTYNVFSAWDVKPYSINQSICRRILASLHILLLITSQTGFSD